MNVSDFIKTDLLFMFRFSGQGADLSVFPNFEKFLPGKATGSKKS